MRQETFFALNSVSVELLQHLLDFVVIGSHNAQGLGNSLEALIIVGFLCSTVVILVLTIVLNLFAAVLDLCETEGG